MHVQVISNILSFYTEWRSFKKYFNDHWRDIVSIPKIKNCHNFMINFIYNHGDESFNINCLYRK